jgi:hypothetical protein
MNALALWLSLKKPAYEKSEPFIYTSPLVPRGAGR